MKIPEFIGGLLVGASIYITVLSTFYLGAMGGGNDVLDQAYVELLLPFIFSVVAGVGIGFGFKGDGDAGYGMNFSEFSEYWPALIGGLGLAGAVGTTMMFYFTGTPLTGLMYAAISIILCVGGSIITVLNWESSSPY